MNNNQDLPAHIGRTDYNDPTHNRRKTPSLPPPSKFYLWLQAFIGPFLAITLTTLVTALLYMWSDLRLIRDENLRTGTWQSDHTAEHRAFQESYHTADIAGAALRYQVGDCKTTLEQLDARLRECEAVTNASKALKGK